MACILKPNFIGQQCENLISKGAEINIKDNFGKTPLHFAVKGGGDKILEFLISKGADVYALDKNGEFPGDFSEDVRRTLIAINKKLNPD